MAAGARIFYCRTVTKNATPIADAVAGRIRLTPGPEFVDPGGAAAPGPVEVQQGGGYDIGFDIFGRDLNVMKALLGSAAENIIFATKGVAGANEKHTLKNGKITAWLGQVEIPDPTSGGVTQVYGVSGRCEWTSTDTLALMWVAAADAA